ncbi:MAG: NAD(P)H-hydrate dehydratase [Chitinophagaceae bacterium]|nr:NAD(P)H-hydrate dehydratase [Chitinophagaceae bacterium]
MKLFTAAQIKAWDQYTVQHEPVNSAELMERAATSCCQWMAANIPSHKQIVIFCGPGNNGGDGLAIARMLIQKGYRVQIYLSGNNTTRSGDFLINLERLQAITNRIELLEEESLFPVIRSSDIVIDALFGYGLNRPLEGLSQQLVHHINSSGVPVIAIDMPSGLFTDKSSKGGTVIHAVHTLTFQVLKPAFLLAENAAYTGNIEVMDIGLHPGYYNETPADYELLDEAHIRTFIQPRKRFSHKGTYGNAALIAGSYGMMGAAVLSARAGMRSGAGKLTCYIPSCGYPVLQTAVPEVMCVTDPHEKYHTSLTLQHNYDAYAIGPGLGQYESGTTVLKTLLSKKPERLIIDADGLNILSDTPQLFAALPPNTILTPHPKEFEKLFGPSVNDFERLELARQKAKALHIYIVLKGHYSFIATPGGKGYFSPTGNPGMATAGSGDVLTGILLGLYAQNGNTEQVVLTGVYLHGLAGDIAARIQSEEALLAGDIIEYIPRAFIRLKTGDNFS